MDNTKTNVEKLNSELDLLDEAKRVKTKANLYRDAVNSLKGIALELMNNDCLSDENNYKEATSVIADIRKYTNKEYELYNRLIEINEELRKED